MKKMQAVDLRVWNLSRYDEPIRDPWLGDECDEQLDTVKVLSVEEFPGNRYGEYRYAIYATDKESNGPASFVWLSTFNPCK